MPLHLRDLLDDVDLALSVVAGKSSLDARGPIRSAHVVDPAAPLSHLDGGELILTTGDSLRGSPTRQKQFVALLDIASAVALTMTEDVPAAMIDAANDRGLPILVAPRNTSFLQITKQVTRLVTLGHEEDIRFVEGFSRVLLTCIGEHSTLNELVARCDEWMPGARLAFVDAYGNRLASTSAYTSEPGPLTKTGVSDRDRNANYSNLQISVNGVVEGTVVWQSSDELEHLANALLQQIGAAITALLLQRNSLRGKYRDEVATQLQRIESGQASALAFLKSRGISESEYRVAIVLAGKQTDLPRLCLLVEDFMAATDAPHSPIVAEWDDGVVCIVGDDDPTIMRSLFRYLTRRGVSARIGFSAATSNPEQLRVSIRQAEVAARQIAPETRDVLDASTLGIDLVVAGVRGQPATDVFIDQTIGPLIAYDRSEGTDLVGTLDTFLRTGGRPGVAAQQLYIHRHTLNQRLDRIAALTGNNPRDGEAMLEFGVALRLIEDRSPNLWPGTQVP